MKLRLDYDKYTFRFVDTLYMLKDIPLPYLVRVSASGEGLHIAKEGNYTYDDPLYIKYDDPRRLRMNRIRQRNGLSHNLLWNVKKSKRPGPWRTIENISDILAFMVQIFDLRINRKSYISLPLSKVLGKPKMKKKLSEIRSRIDILLDNITDSMEEITINVGEIKSLMVESGEGIQK